MLPGAAVPPPCARALRAAPRAAASGGFLLGLVSGLGCDTAFLERCLERRHQIDHLAMLRLRRHLAHLLAGNFYWAVACRSWPAPVRDCRTCDNRGGLINRLIQNQAALAWVALSSRSTFSIEKRKAESLPIRRTMRLQA